mgnify:FL=1
MSKNRHAFHLKFQNVSISSNELESDSDHVRKVYQYTTFNGKACVWDANGNLIQYGDNTDVFKYDAFNRMVEANGVKYLYDAQNRRVANIEGRRSRTPTDGEDEVSKERGPWKPEWQCGHRSEEEGCPELGNLTI